MFHRWKATTSACIHWDLFLSNTSDVSLHCFVSLEVFLKLAFLQVRLEAEYFLCDFLVLPLYAFELRLALIEVQTLGLEFDGSD